MAFSASCARADRPKVYLIHNFVAGQGSLYDYPYPVLESFDRTMSRNMVRFERGTNQTLPSATAPRLFDLIKVRDVRQIPAFLGSGDVVLGFGYFPPYEVSRLSEELTGPEGATPSGSHNPIDAAMKKVSDRFWNKIVAQWKAKATNPPPTDAKAAIASALVGISCSVLQTALLTLRGGGSAGVYYGYRIGLVDIAFPAAAALWVWNNGTVRGKKLKALATHAFGPKAVAQAAAGDAKRGQYLAVVGRGLAYNLLHEFWHAAERRSDHPYQQSNKTIENATGANPMFDNLVFQTQAVSNVLQEYEQTWCTYLDAHRVGIGELK